MGPEFCQRLFFDRYFFVSFWNIPFSHRYTKTLESSWTGFLILIRAVIVVKLLIHFEYQYFHLSYKVNVKNRNVGYIPKLLQVWAIGNYYYYFYYLQGCGPGVFYSEPYTNIFYCDWEMMLGKSYQKAHRKH